MSSIPAYLISCIELRRSKMNTQEVIDFINKLWSYADRELMSSKEYKELGKKRKEVVDYIRKLSGVHF